MIQNILKNWNLIRLLRLAMGIFLVVEAIKSGMWFLVAIGVVFVAMPLLNIGCCSTSNCSMSKKKKKNKSDEVEYEEIK